MRTDSVRVADEALAAVRDAHRRARTARSSCPRSRTTTRRRPTRRTRTRRSGRPRCRYDPETVRPYLTPDQFSLYRLIWNRFVASQMTAGHLRRDDGRHRRGRLRLPRQGHRAEVRRLDGDVRPDRVGGRRSAGRRRGRRRDGRRGRWRVGRAAAARRRRSAGAEACCGRSRSSPSRRRGSPRRRSSRSSRRTGSDARAPTRRSSRAAGPRLRAQDRRGASSRPPSGRIDQRPARQELRRHPRRRVHAQHGGGPRQDRAGQGRLREDARRASTRSSRRTSTRAGKEMQNFKERVKPTDEKCDKCGPPMVIKVGKFGPFIACSALSRVHEHAGAGEERAGAETGEEEDEPCENCGQADGRQARAVRAVPGLHGLPRVQDDAQADRDQAGRPEGGEAGSGPRREVPAVRREPRDQAGAVRRVHRVHQLPGVQVRQAEDAPA